MCISFRIVSIGNLRIVKLFHIVVNFDILLSINDIREATFLFRKVSRLTSTWNIRMSEGVKPRLRGMRRVFVCVDCRLHDSIG